MSGTLYLVGTPIGNLEDMTYRAVRVLQEVDIIACEDTRHSLGLLAKYEIKKPLMSYYMHKERESGQRILQNLLEGKDVALITDAGMPCISDPGAIVVEMARESGYDVKVVPGASAVVSAMALSGITKKGFCFLGFLPEKQKDKRQLLAPYANIDIQLVFYCSPHDINQDIKVLAECLGGDRRIFAVKEITKIYEGVQQGMLNDFNIEEPRGEYVLIVEGREQNCCLNELSIQDHLKSYIGGGMDKKSAIKQTAKDRGLPKDEVYKVALELDI